MDLFEVDPRLRTNGRRSVVRGESTSEAGKSGDEISLPLIKSDLVHFNIRSKTGSWSRRHFVGSNPIEQIKLDAF